MRNDFNCILHAFKTRQSSPETMPIRLFYGVSEGTSRFTKKIAIDRFGKNAWVTIWGERDEEVSLFENEIEELAALLQEQGYTSGILLFRPEKGLPEDATFFFETEDAPREIEVKEHGITYLIKLTLTKHPGLFLDHEPLRDYLTKNSSEKSVLNLFAYTGSLSAASVKGNASQVTTVDLSSATCEWAKENFRRNGFSTDTHTFFAQDTFYFLKKTAKLEKKFDVVIADPPSFSRSEHGVFSTSKDLARLIEACLLVLKPGGIFILSINSENIPLFAFEEKVRETLARLRRSFLVISRIELPPSFPTLLSDPESRYLKGLILEEIVK